jgi:monoamine oxidase
LMNIENGAQQERFVGGTQTVANRLADTFKEHIRLNSVVKKIVQNTQNKKNTEGSITVSGEGYSIDCQRVIVAIPPTLAGRIDYHPMLPANREQLTQRVPMGQVWKTYAIYDKPFWREKGLNGLAATDIGHTTVTFDCSPKDGSKGILMGFVLADQAKLFSNLNSAERKESILSSFAILFGEQARHPQHYLDHSWAEEEFTRGCYAGVFPTNTWTTLGEWVKKPIGNIHWAGTETSDVWNGYIEGAIRSGERVAKEILDKY